MTTTAQPHHDLDALARYPGISTTVTGTEQEVAELLRRARAAGRLLAMTMTLPDRGGLVVVQVRLRAVPTAVRPAEIRGRPAAPAPRWTRGQVAAAAAAALVLLAVAAVAVVAAVQWLLANLAVVVAVLVVAGLLLAWARKAGICPGVVVHCRNCRH